MDTENPDGIWQGVVQCEEHQHQDDDCNRCRTQEAQMIACLDQLQAEAGTRAAGLGKLGVQMPQEVFNAIKVDLIIDTLFADSKNRLKFEGEFGRRLVETYKQAQSEATKQTLAPEQRLTVVRNGMPKQKP